MSDSEEDYISDKLLTACAIVDEKPGLLSNRTQKRTHELCSKQMEESKKPKTYHEQEKEATKKGLNTAISSDIGFKKLLQEVGYIEDKSRAVPTMDSALSCRRPWVSTRHRLDPESLENALHPILLLSPDSIEFKKLIQKIGYAEDKSLEEPDTDNKEPVNLPVKQNTSGVHRVKHVDKGMRKRRKVKEEHVELSKEEYLAARHEEPRSFLVRHDYYKSQRICEDLDTKQGILEPVEPYFWPRQIDMKVYSNHREISEDSEDEEREIIVDHVLYKIIQYLRDKHWYCIYCGFKGTDEQDLEANCPGVDRYAHWAILN